MIDSVSHVAAAQAQALNLSTAGVTPTAAPSQGWAQLGLGDGSGNLPSVGAGRDLSWARSWSDLSGRLRSVGTNMDQLAMRMTKSQTTEDVQVNMAGMLQASRQMTETSIEFQMTSGLLTNAASSVNKLLTQQ